MEAAHLAWTHNGCVCNDEIALTHRHQVATRPVTRDMTPVLDILARLRPPGTEKLQPWKRWKVVRSYKGQWHAKYLHAHQERAETGLLHKHRIVKMFNKPDLEMGVPAKAPRAIQYRHPVFGLEQARYTKPMERWFYGLRDKFGTKIVGKSDPFTIASELRRKASHFSTPCYLLLDASKFDSCVDVKWLRATKEFYKTLFPRREWSRIEWLWTRTLLNVGRTQSGIRYKTNGTRMSGDMDTGLGNSIIMYSLLTCFLESHGVFKHSIMVNGDDSVVVIERAQLAPLRDLSLFEEYGFDMKFEVAYEFEQVDFCQARPVETDYGWTMARRPDRIMGRTSWSTLNLSKSKARGFVRTLGMCERAASWGLPIASALATAMISSTVGATPRLLTPWLSEHYALMRKWWKRGEPTISLQTRLNFSEAWNISVEEQLAIEKSIRVRVLARPTEAQLVEYSLLCH